MKIKLSIILIFALITLPLGSCNKGTPSLEAEAQKSEGILLERSEDAPDGYIDSFIFIGESTTAHLKNRGVLSGGTDTAQVWSGERSTLTLGIEIDKAKIIYPPTNERLTFFEAAKRAQPQYFLLTFGLNGAVQNVKRGEEYFKECYKKLIRELHRGSPQSKIIIQSCFPVAKNMDMSAYSVDVQTLNEYIDLLNSWSYSVALDENCRYLDSSQVFKDADGYLKNEFQAGDGHHLTKEAYLEMLKFIKSHPYR